MRRALVVRLDGAGDVLLAGPAVRAVAARAQVTMLCGPAGTAAARLLPGVAEVLTWASPWVLADPPPIRQADLEGLVSRVAGRRIDEAVVLTSYHQSPLPTALLLRLAGVARITGASVDYPGALLDVRLRPGENLPEDIPEPERMLAIAAVAGYPAADGEGLAVRPPPAVSGLVPDGPYVVVHPGAAAPARRWPARHAAHAVSSLADAGWQVVVTGGPDERLLTAAVAGAAGTDLGGRTDLAQLSGVLARASAVVVGNTGAAHLSAAVGTPVVSLFAPIVPAVRWRPVPRAAPAPRRPGRGVPRLAGPRMPRPGPPLPRGRHARNGRGCRRGPHRDRRHGGARVNVLIWHVHGSWTTAFVQGRHRYLLPTLPERGPWGGGRAAAWDWPTSTVELSPADLADEPVDVVVLQRPEEAGLAADWLGRVPGRDVPAVYLEHNAPRGPAATTRHPFADRDDLLLVHVTHFNALMWDTGRTRTAVVEHGVIDPGARWTGELRSAAVCINEPVRRGRITGTDLLPGLAEAMPLDVFGIGVDRLAEHLRCDRVRAVADLPQHRLHDELARRAAYVHTARWTSLGLSLIEAMLLGMPVVALATTEAAEVVPPEAGVCSSDPARLRVGLRRLVEDRDVAAGAGRAAREAALARFGVARFLADWDAVLDQVATEHRAPRRRCGPLPVPSVPPTRS